MLSFRLKIKVIWIWTCALIFIELIDDFHLMCGQLEIEDLCVFDDSTLRHRFWNGDNTMLQVPAKNDLSHGFIMFFRNILKNRMVQQLPAA